MKVTFIATVFDEEKTIEDFFDSIFRQSKAPDEIIIVDGKSSDQTVVKIRKKMLEAKDCKGKFKILVKEGNRAVGRNEAIRNSTNEIIICSDAGCILDKDWVKNIVEPFKNPKIEVVSGYYKGKAKTIFQKCLIPYVLVMPDKVDVNNFLPATRSIAFKKSIWKKIGGFPEEYSNNEDYVFAKKLKKINANIVFEESAFVNWIPRKNMGEAFEMFYRFAKGDSEANIFRPKVLLIFIRYLLAIILLSVFFIIKSDIVLNTLYLIFLIYVLWSIVKNFRYINNLAAIFYLPIIQIASDLAIIMGTSVGVFNSKKENNDKK